GLRDFAFGSVFRALQLCRLTRRQHTDSRADSASRRKLSTGLPLTAAPFRAVAATLEPCLASHLTDRSACSSISAAVAPTRRDSLPLLLSRWARMGSRMEPPLAAVRRRVPASFFQ